MWGHDNLELSVAQEKAKQQAIEKCRQTGVHANAYCDDGDAYAYPAAEGKIHWGVNGSEGFNIARGTVS